MIGHRRYAAHVRPLPAYLPLSVLGVGGDMGSFDGRAFNGRKVVFPKEQESLAAIRKRACYIGTSAGYPRTYEARDFPRPVLMSSLHTFMNAGIFQCCPERKLLDDYLVIFWYGPDQKVGVVLVKLYFHASELDAVQELRRDRCDHRRIGTVGVFDSKV